jgi:isopenicillin N synthase-like dioxygenase
MEHNIVDELSADAINKYAICMQMEKELAEHEADDHFRDKLKVAESSWELAHSAWEDALQKYAEELSNKKA